MPSRIRTSALLLACALVSMGTTARSEDLPSVDEVLNRFIEATGGEKAWKSVTSYRTEGGFEMPAMGLNATVIMMGNQSGDSYLGIEIPGAGTQSQGVSGDVAWEHSLMSGPRIKEGAEAISSKRQADLLWFVDWKKYYSEGTCVGVEEIGGESCYRLELTTTEASPETHYFSVESGLERQMEMTVPSQMGDIAAVTSIDEYTEFEGLRLPTKMTQRAAGMEQVITITSFEKNPKFGPGVFALPAEVEALLAPVGQ